MALVLAYALLYYRVLGLLTALSLVASGAFVFALLVLLADISTTPWTWPVSRV